MPEEQIGNFFVTCNKICEIVISYKSAEIVLASFLAYDTGLLSYLLNLVGYFCGQYRNLFKVSAPKQQNGLCKA